MSATVRYPRQGDDSRPVQIAGSFNGWQPVAMQLSKDGTGFTYTIRAPAGSKQEYKFVTPDGQWVLQPGRPTTPDAHGVHNHKIIMEQGSSAEASEERETRSGRPVGPSRSHSRSHTREGSISQLNPAAPSFSPTAPVFNPGAASWGGPPALPVHAAKQHQPQHQQQRSRASSQHARSRSTASHQHARTRSTSRQPGQEHHHDHLDPAAAPFKPQFKQPTQPVLHAQGYAAALKKAPSPPAQHLARDRHSASTTRSSSTTPEQKESPAAQTPSYAEKAKQTMNPAGEELAQDTQGTRESPDKTIEDVQAKSPDNAAKPSNAIQDAADKGKHNAQHAGAVLGEQAEKPEETSAGTAETINDTAAQTMEAANNTANEAEKSLKEPNDATADKPERVVETAEDKAVKMEEVIEEKAREEGQSAKEAKDAALAQASQTASIAQEKAIQAKEAVQEQLSVSAEAVTKQTSQAINNVKENAVEMKDSAAEALSSAKEKAQAQGRQAGEAVQEASQKIDERVQDSADRARSEVAKFGHAIEEAAQEGKENARHAGAVLQEKAKALPEKVSDAASQASTTIQHISEDVQEKASSVKNLVAEKAEGVAGTASHVGAAVQEKAGDLKDAVADTVNNVVDSAAETGVALQNSAAKMSAAASVQPQQAADAIGKKSREAYHGETASAYALSAPNTELPASDGDQHSLSTTLKDNSVRASADCERIEPAAEDALPNLQTSNPKGAHDTTPPQTESVKPVDKVDAVAEPAAEDGLAPPKRPVDLVEAEIGDSFGKASQAAKPETVLPLSAAGQAKVAAEQAQATSDSPRPATAKTTTTDLTGDRPGTSRSLGARPSGNFVTWMLRSLFGGIFRGFNGLFDKLAFWRKQPRGSPHSAAVVPPQSGQAP